MNPSLCSLWSFVVNSFPHRRCFLLSVAILLLLLSAVPTPAGLMELRDKQIAAVVVPQGATATPLQRSAQSRLESILVDNGFSVLDRRKAAELKDANKRLEDPTAFITAEDFIKMAEAYQIHALVVVYLHADARPGLADYFSATAQADVRVIDDVSARVQAFNTQPMGTRGMAPSQGLTANSALLNAVYRAVDAAADKMQLELSDRTRLRSVRLSLGEPVKLSTRLDGKPANERDLHRLAKLEKAKWRTEEVSVTARSPGGALAAVAGYIRDTDHHRRPPRLYGSRVHVVEPASGKTIHLFECSPVEKKGRDERGTKEVLDTTFVSNWRYLAAVTGNHVLFWDTETGSQISRRAHPKALKKARVQFMRNDRGTYLAVGDGKRVTAYPIVRDR